MLKYVLLIGAAAVSFPALAQTEPTSDQPAPTQSEAPAEPATTTDPAPEPDQKADTAQPAPDSTTTAPTQDPDSDKQDEPAAEPDSPPQ